MKSDLTPVSTSELTLALADAPNTPITDTSIRPRVRANAVAAVRRGLRTALVRASRPTAPNGRATTAPSPATNGRDSAGAASRTAMIRANAPMPTVEAAPPPVPWAPTTTTAAPTTAATAPTTVRIRSDSTVAVDSSRMAATGATLLARRAGA